MEIEITEGAIMDNVQEGMELLHAIKTRGIRIAIDDFGTGYSSLSYLKKFLIDVLKIDKSFVDNLPHNQDDIAISNAIISMAKALGYQVLAEGVENKEQLTFLKEHGCDIFQGYYKSRPLPTKEFEELLAN
ncbi:Diguanylate cyclase/phosphodiesterase domain 2 [hydrothermal vent metagenome]|uniref:Diguanylate cyclase/phosphodiesterase domain 2 n=1 Tax=hydrothermal vent metagenome TaxID=652676 RepID=A0A1W1C4H1_9ZZZZ